MIHTGQIIKKKQLKPKPYRIVFLSHKTTQLIEWFFIDCMTYYCERNEVSVSERAEQALPD